MLLMLLLLIPLVGIFLISSISYVNKTKGYPLSTLNQIKTIGLLTSVINFFVSLIVFMLFNFSSNQFQSVQEYHRISSLDFYLGVDGISIYFVLLTTIIMPISLLSNWTCISENVKSYVMIILLLETLLLLMFLTLLNLSTVLIIIILTYFIMPKSFYTVIIYHINKLFAFILYCCINASPKHSKLVNLSLESSSLLAALAFSFGAPLISGAFTGGILMYGEMASAPRYGLYRQNQFDERIRVYELTTFSDNSYTHPSSNPFTEFPSIDCFN